MLVASLFVVGACGGGADGPIGPRPRVDVLLPSNSVSLVVGQSQALTVIVTGTANTGVAWSTSAPSIVNVSGAGLVTALAAGSATVTATAIADPTRSATATVTVSPPVVVTLGASTLSLLQGATQQLTAAVTGTLNTSVSWSSSSISVATVSLSGLVSAVGAGTATITATSIADATKSASLSVTVTPVSFSIAPAAVALSVGGSQQLTATVNGTASTAVTYATSTATVAAVSTTGLITAVTAGSAIITVRLTSDPARSLTVPVTVVSAAGTLLASGVPVTNISAAEDSVRLFRLFVPAGTTQLDLRTTGGTGDLDLYVARVATLRTTSDIVCASEGSGNEERCTIPNPAAGDWYIYLYAFEAFAGATLSGTTSGGPAPTSGYTLSLTSPSITVERGASAQVTITAVREAGFSGTITLGTATLPSGVTATFSPATLGAGVSAATLTIAAGSAATIGSGPLTVTGASLGLTDRAATATLSVTAPSGGSNATPLTSGVPVTNLSGASASSTLYRIVVPSGTPNLQVRTSAGSGLLRVLLRRGFPPTSTTFDNEATGAGTVWLADVPNPTPGDWYVLIVGTQAYQGVSLTASAAGYTLGLSPASLTLAPGAAATVNATITRVGGFSGAVTLAVQGLPAGVTVSPAIIAAGATTTTLTFTAAANATGNATATISGTTVGLPDRTATLVLNVAQPGIVLTLQSQTVLLARGASGTIQVGLARTGGYTGAVSLSISGLPSGVSATFTPSQLGSNEAGSTLAFTVSSTAPIATSAAIVQASGSGVPSASLPITMNVSGTPPRIASFQEWSIPGVTASNGVGAGRGLTTTNEGVYFQLSDDAGTVLRATGGPSITWKSWVPTGRPKHWVPSKTRTEQRDEFSVHFVRFGDRVGDEPRIGVYSLNSGVPTFDMVDDRIFNNKFRMYIPGAPAAGLDWAFSGDSVFLQSRNVRGPGTRSRFDNVAKATPSMAIADTADLVVYVVEGSNLLKITSSGIVQTWPLPARNAGLAGTVTQMQWASGALWIGYDGQVLRLRNGQLSVFNTLADANPVRAALQSFCITGGWLYTTDGMRYSVNGGAGVDFLGDMSGVTDQATLINYQILKARVGGSVLTCLQSSLSTQLWLIWLDKLVTLTPL